ncbi:MAG TPA: MlaD family protein [Gemmatimonadaceae bacterium]|nr:MlaD family protein [Gemmatimonadaceae bacterium]
MASRPRWNDLIVGAIAIAVVAALAVAILLFGNVGALHGKTFRVFVTTDEARGVIRGTEVWLDGQKVGLVKGVGFQSANASPSDRIVLALDVLDRVRPQIRRDSRVSMRTGGSIIGNEVVYVTTGTARAQGVRDGDTIHAATQTDYEATTSEATEAAHQLPAIIDNVKLIGAQLRSAEGTLGAFGLDGSTELARVRARTDRVMGRLSSSNGTVSMVLSQRSALQARAQEAMAAADSLRALVGSNQHSLGRFRRDSTLTREIAEVRAELARVQQLAMSPNGTIGRFRTDSAIVRGLHRDIASMDSLFADVQKHPLRYIAF